MARHGDFPRVSRWSHSWLRSYSKRSWACSQPTRHTHRPRQQRPQNGDELLTQFRRHRLDADVGGPRADVRRPCGRRRHRCDHDRRVCDRTSKIRLGRIPGIAPAVMEGPWCKPGPLSFRHDRVCIGINCSIRTENLASLSGIR